MEDIQEDKGSGLSKRFAQVSAAEQETAYLLASPQNAMRLIAALQEAADPSVLPETIQELRRSVGLDDPRIG
jgi:hypothetical protein